MAISSVDQVGGSSAPRVEIKPAPPPPEKPAAPKPPPTPSSSFAPAGGSPAMCLSSPDAAMGPDVPWHDTPAPLWADPAAYASVLASGAITGLWKTIGSALLSSHFSPELMKKMNDIGGPNPSPTDMQGTTFAFNLILKYTTYTPAEIAQMSNFEFLQTALTVMKALETR